MKLHAFIAAAALALAVSPTAQACFAMPAPTPVDRIVKNTEAKLAKTPGDVELRYQLARVHYLAFALKRSELGTYTRGDEAVDAESVASKDFQNWSTKKSPQLKTAEALKHAARSAELFQEVLGKQPKHTLANLGLGSLLEQYATETAKEPPKDPPAILAKHDGATIRQHYEVAFEQAWRKERDAKAKNIDGLDGFISYEAAQAYLRSAKADADKLTGEEKENVFMMTEAVKKLEALPRAGIITPLVFSRQPAATIDALLAPDVAVDFDLRGFGLEERWSWLRPETGLLVWDPTHEGMITSARQLFGSYTWRLFWRDGFAALAALDDNQDGWLRGAELDGLAVWFDRDQNGISDRGEVVPLSALAVTALACAAPEMEGPHPVHRHGIEFQNGQAVPLWDWVTSPLPPVKPAVAKE